MDEASRHSGMYFPFRLQAEEEDGADSLLTHVAAEGMGGIPQPYRLRDEGLVTGVLFLCFILTSYVLAHGKNHLEQRLKRFFSSRRRGVFSGDPMASSGHYTLILLAQTCVLVGLCMFNYLANCDPALFGLVPHGRLLVTYVGYTLCFLLAKWVTYGVVNWIFFNNANNVAWMESYADVVTCAGLGLFPIVLLIVYFDLPPEWTSYALFTLVIIAKMLLLYKCFSNFFNNIHGLFHLILYFCALEILPDLVWWKGILTMNDSLILNYLEL